MNPHDSEDQGGGRDTPDENAEVVDRPTTSSGTGNRNKHGAAWPWSWPAGVSRVRSARCTDGSAALSSRRGFGGNVTRRLGGTRRGVLSVCGFVL